MFGEPKSNLNASSPLIIDGLSHPQQQSLEMHRGFDLFRKRKSQDLLDRLKQQNAILTRLKVSNIEDAFKLAVESCNKNDLEIILNFIPNLDATVFELRGTALHRAILNDQQDLILVLLKAGAATNIKDATLKTAEEYAIERGISLLELKSKMLIEAINESCTFKQFERLVKALVSLAECKLKNKDYLYTAKLLNCALAVVKTYPEKIPNDSDLLHKVQKSLLHLEKTFLKEELGVDEIGIGKAAVGFEEEPNDIVFKARLTKLRQTVQRNLEKIPSANGLPSEEISEFIQNLFKWIATEIRKLVVDLYKSCLEQMPMPAPCEYAFLATGSLAREEMTPYSDFESFLLISEATFENKQYFSKLFQLFELRVINLGETPLTSEMDPFSLEVCALMPKGFCLDAHKKPHDLSHDLIDTPESLAKYQLELSYVHLPGNHLSSALVNALEIFVSTQGKTLFKSYQDLLAKNLSSEDQQVNIKHILKRFEVDGARFAPQFGHEKSGHLFQVKEDLYRLPQMIVEGMALQQGINCCSTWERVKQLGQRGFILPAAAKRISLVLSAVEVLRLRNYEKHKKQTEVFDFLASPSGEVLETLVEIYKTLIPLFKLSGQFYKEDGVKNCFQTELFYEADPVTNGDIYIRLCQYQQALEYYQMAEKLFARDGNEQMMMLVSSRILTIYFYLEKHRDCVELIKRTIDLKVKKVNNNEFDVSLAIDYNHLCNVLYDLSELEESIKYGAKVLKIAESVPGPNLNFYLILNQTIINLGFCYFKQGLYDKAMYYLETAFKSYRGYFGDDAKVATVLNTLGTISLSLKKHLEAENYFRESISIFVRYYGVMHPKVSMVSNNLAILYSEIGDYDQALYNLNRSLNIDLKVFGDNHPDIATRLNNLGALHHSIGNQQLAISYFERSLAILKYNFGESHSYIASIYNNIASVYRSTERYDEAIVYFQMAIKAHEDLGEELATAATFNELAAMYGEKGDMRLALEYFNKALIIHERIRDPLHPDIAKDYNNLSYIWKDRGRTERSMEHLEIAKAYVDRAKELSSAWNDKDQVKQAIDKNHVEILELMGSLQQKLQIH